MMSKLRVCGRVAWLVVALLLIEFVGFSTVAYAAGETVVVPQASERTITVAAGQTAYIAPNIELNNFGFDIASAKVIIENIPSDASVSYTDVAGLSVTYESAKKVYTVSGVADASDYQTLFRSFRIHCGTTMQNDIIFRFVVSENTTTPMYYAGTGHYYEYISDPAISWIDAAGSASGRTYNGMEGYLVTITSAEENAFVVAKMAESGWIGASDALENNTWIWGTGPEAGTQFWQGLSTDSGGYAVGGAYSNWLAGEPNDDGGTGHFAHIFVNSPGWEFATTTWNDMPNVNTFVQGYTVEYGDMPDDAPEDFDETVTVNIGASVTYNANSATGGTVPVDSNSPYTSGASVTVLSNSGTLERTGYVFYGWNTQTDGSGTHYDATGSDTFSISSNTTLYAQWDCSITYDANDATGGSVPIDVSSPYSPGTSVTVKSNSGMLERTNYSFNGWNTQADGSGTHYDATGSDTFNIASNTTLYAQWDCSITYDENGATGGSVPVDASSPYSPGTNVTVLSNSGALVKTGETFAGWNTQADGNGTPYDASGSDTFNTASNTTLYAQWGCNVTYDANGATGGSVPVDASAPYESGTSVTVLTNSGTLERTGYVFVGWNTQSDGDGTHYDATGSDTFTILSNTTLYAQWRCSVTYDMNGATGGSVPVDGSSPYAPGESVTVRTNSGTLERTGYVFDGWNTQAGGGGTHYDASGYDSFTITSNVTLYSDWEADTDGDGTSDADEVGAGTDPNDANDAPKKGTISVTVYHQDGSPASGLICVLNSTPVVVVTDANGVAQFTGVSLMPHTLELRNGTNQIGNYSLNFTRGTANSTTVTDDASTDSDGGVTTIVTNRFLRLDLTIQQNVGGFWQIGDADYAQRAMVDNPETGDYRISFSDFWNFLLQFRQRVLCIALHYFKKVIKSMLI